MFVTARFTSCLLVVVLCGDCMMAGPSGPDKLLPGGVEYRSGVPTPASLLGYEVGQWHVRHDQVVRYFEVLAGSSPRVELETYGRTHEGRPLLLATVSTPANLARIDEIRQNHLAALDGGSGGDDQRRPAVVWLGYSVHGNEASGANASLLVAYYLAAATGPEVAKLLENTIILIDPAINPDGLGRFTQWANAHRGDTLVGDPEHREHREAWPGGRTNHYWFDLNRDWILLTQPESRARIEKYHQWKPNVVADFHEMGADRTYFFQPGVPSRQNPNTPDLNLDLTRRISRYHAEILDRTGELYYTEESFDDFYYGKGSTYPDANGGIGILFEQATSRGHLHETSFGPRSFASAVRNQLMTSLSTLSAVVEMREELLAYQREFYATAVRSAERDPVRAYVIDGSEHRQRASRLLDVLLRHRIVVASLASPVARNGRTYRPGTAYIVPMRQPGYRLARALLERRTEFADETFYDVSTWTLPLSFGLPSDELHVGDFSPDLVGKRLMDAPQTAGRFSARKGAYAWLFEWTPYGAPRAARRLQGAGLRLRVATRPLRAMTREGEREFGYGTIVVPRGIQEVQIADALVALRAAAAEDGVEIHGVETGLTPGGIDLGSPNVLEVKEPRPALVVGTGVSGYEAGEVWHLLDTRYRIAVSMVELRRVGQIDLARYTHLILVSGRYGALDEASERIGEWVRRGGVLVALCSAVPWVERHILEPRKGESENPPATEEGDADDASDPRSTHPDDLSYADYERLRARNRVNGAILEARLDLTHPLAFGYRRETLPVFRTSTIILEPEDDPFATVARYTDSPLLSGYVSARNLEKIGGSAVVCARRQGRGVVIRIVDNLNFRGVWYGTNKIFANALFFGSCIKSTGPLDADR